MLANVLGYLFLGEVLTSTQYVGVTLAVAAFIVLAMRYTTGVVRKDGADDFVQYIKHDEETEVEKYLKTKNKEECLQNVAPRGGKKAAFLCRARGNDVGSARAEYFGVGFRCTWQATGRYRWPC